MNTVIITTFDTAKKVKEILSVSSRGTEELKKHTDTSPNRMKTIHSQI